MAAKKDISVEDAFLRIQELIDRMEDQDISLEDSLKYYDEGTKLLKFCNDALDRAEKKLVILREQEPVEDE